MDTTTVLEIIKMIDIRMDNLAGEDGINLDDTYSEEYQRYVGMGEIRDHLQSFIENEVNKAEQ